MEHFVLAENRIYNLNHYRDFSSKVILLKKTLDKKIPIIKKTCKKYMYFIRMLEMFGIRSNLRFLKNKKSKKKIQKLTTYLNLREVL